MAKRNYSRPTIKKLYGFSGSRCYCPECNKLLIARDEDTIISKICHIEAASKNGPRYRAKMTDDERNHFNNLILLCDECHSIIDSKNNEAQYPVVLLKEWKTNHENKVLESFKKDTSFLSIAINAIANIDFNDNLDHSKESLNAFSVETKIKYNSIKRNKFLIEDYKVYYSKLNSLYNELEEQGSFKKEKLLQNIKKAYLKIKGKYVGDSVNAIEIIQQNSDNIIEEIQDELLQAIEKNNNYQENIVFGLDIIMVDAFMCCKILEEPVSNDNN